MKKIHAGRKISLLLLCLILGLTTLSPMAVSAASDDIGSRAEPGEVLNSVEQGETGTYTVEKSGYYLINLRGADGGDGQDVCIESDGMGSTDSLRGKASAQGGNGADGGSVSTLVYLKKGQVLSYSIGADGTNYTEQAYRFEDLQRGYIHVYPNSNPQYQPDKYVDAGFGGGGGEGTWVSVDDVVIAGAAGGGGGGGSVAVCANWGGTDPSGQKSKGANGGNASASTSISEEFTSIEAFDGEDGVKSQGESVKTGEEWPAVSLPFVGEIAPAAPKYTLTKFEAGAGGASGTSYINKAAKLYYGDEVPAEVAASDVYANASAPETSGIVITFVLEFQFNVEISFGDSDTTHSVAPGTTVDLEIPKPDPLAGYFKGWLSSDGRSFLARDYFGTNTITVNYDTATDTSYTPVWYDTSKMGIDYVSNAKAQAVCISDGNGGTQNAIRFLAMIDEDYASYQKAGFILSTASPTPTVEAGNIYSTQYNLYKRILTRSTVTGETTYLDINSDELKDIFGFEKAAGLIYTNVIINEGNEDKTYYATPYIVNADGEYVYGKTRAVSLNELKANDEAVANAQ